jgi:hypothetical protein
MPTNIFNDTVHILNKYFSCLLLVEYYFRCLLLVGYYDFGGQITVHVSHNIDTMNAPRQSAMRDRNAVNISQSVHITKAVNGMGQPTVQYRMLFVEFAEVQFSLSTVMIEAANSNGLVITRMRTSKMPVAN